MRVFQIVVIGAFVLFIVAGVITFALFRGGLGGEAGKITVWGMIPEKDFSALAIAVFGWQTSKKVEYVKKEADDFEKEFVEALASGGGPDAVILPQDLIIRHSNKIYPVSYDLLSQRDFLDAFAEEGEIFFRDDGILAVPLLIDPLVMYWNRDIFSSAGIALPPETWDQFLLLPAQLTRKDKALNIAKSAVALGEFQNIGNAKEILATLLFQSGNFIMGKTAEGKYSSTLPLSSSAENAIAFYAEFANPVKPIYSWNRALPDSQNFFLSGNLAIYFGLAGEKGEIRAKNPNLNFDVSLFPQPRGVAAKVTFGKMLALAVLKNSPKAAVAVNAILALSGREGAAALSASSALPPARRDLLSIRPADAYQTVFYDSAVRSRAWFDPNPTESAGVFKRMIESVTSGKAKVSEAVNLAGSELNALSAK